MSKYLEANLGQQRWTRWQLFAEWMPVVKACVCVLVYLLNYAARLDALNIFWENKWILSWSVKLCGWYFIFKFFFRNSHVWYKHTERRLRVCDELFLTFFWAYANLYPKQDFSSFTKISRLQICKVNVFMQISYIILFLAINIIQQIIHDFIACIYIWSIFLRPAFKRL